MIEVYAAGLDVVDYSVEQNRMAQNPSQHLNRGRRKIDRLRERIGSNINQEEIDSTAVAIHFPEW